MKYVNISRLNFALIVRDVKSINYINLHGHCNLKNLFFRKFDLLKTMVESKMTHIISELVPFIWQLISYYLYFLSSVSIHHVTNKCLIRSFKDF